MIQKIKNNPYIIAAELSLKEEKIFKLDYVFMFIQLLIQGILYYLFFVSFLNRGKIDYREVTFYYISVNFIFVSIEAAMYFAYEIMIHLQSGVISLFVVRPISYIKYKYFEKLGKTALVLSVNLLLMLIIRGLLFGSISLNNLLITFVSSICSFTILFFIQGIIGCFTRFFLDITRFRDVIYTILLIFGGKVLPVEMMPETIKGIIKFTPIPYIFDVPVNLFAGRINNLQIFMQIIWVLILGIIFNLIYKFWIKDNIENFS